MRASPASPPLTIHHTVVERLLKDGLRDRPMPRSCRCPVPATIPNGFLPLAAQSQTMGPCFRWSQGFDLGAQRQLNRLAGGPGRRDDMTRPRGWFRLSD
jgi:hypothetical protein